MTKTIRKEKATWKQQTMHGEENVKGQSIQPRQQQKHYPYIYLELRNIAIRKYWILKKIQHSKDNKVLSKLKNASRHEKQEFWMIRIENFQGNNHTNIE